MMRLLYKLFCILPIAFCIGFAPFGGALPAFAQDDLYTVEGVEVDVTAANAVEAREKALEEAQVAAYKLLAERLLSEEELKTFVMPDPLTISGLVQDFELTREQLSSVRYKGTFTIRFRPNAIRYQLSAEGVPYTDTARRPVLILPYYQHAGGTVLWDQNPWMAAWAAAGSRGSLVPVVVPLGDLLDVSQMPGGQPFSYNPEQLRSMVSRYNADEAVLAVASPDPQGGLSVTLYSTANGRPEFLRSVQAPSQAGEPPEALMARAQALAAQALQNDWKAQTAPASAADIRTLEAVARFSSVQEWVQIQNALERVSGVRSLQVQALKPRQADLRIEVMGTVEGLALSLAQYQVDLHMGRSYSSGYGDRAQSIYELTLRRPAPSYSREY